MRTPYHNENRLTPEMMFPNEDWVLTPRAMRGYLQYRLYVLDNQIEKLMSELERRSGPPFPDGLDDRAFPDRSWASWANLNYLLRARELLQDALLRTKRRLN